jgi:GNAT superfamily N-acetyltransferase
MEAVYDAWRARLGDPRAFRRPGGYVRVRPADDDDSITVVALLERVLVSVARTVPLSLVTALANHRPAQALVEEATMARVVGGIERILGPAVLAYLDRKCFVPVDTLGVQQTDRNDPRLAELADGAGQQDADESDIRAWPSCVWIATNGAEVTAAAGYEIWGSAVAHLGVLTEPGYRGRGLGRRVAAAAAAGALSSGLVPQWRARTDHTASRRIATALGFEERGRQATFWPG